MRSRTTGAIALTHSTGNVNGHMFFMSLATGKRISRGQWTPLPIPEEAIMRVEEIATTEGQPLIQNSRIIVEWRPDQPFEDSDDIDYVYDDVGEEDEELLEADYDWEETDKYIQQPVLNTPPISDQVLTEHTHEDQGAHNNNDDHESYNDTEDQGAYEIESDQGAYEYGSDQGAEDTDFFTGN